MRSPGRRATSRGLEPGQFQPCISSRLGGRVDPRRAQGRRARWQTHWCNKSGASAEARARTGSTNARTPPPPPPPARVLQPGSRHAHAWLVRPWEPPLRQEAEATGSVAAAVPARLNRPSAPPCPALASRPPSCTADHPADRLTLFPFSPSPFPSLPHSLSSSLPPMQHATMQRQRGRKGKRRLVKIGWERHACGGSKKVG